MKIINKIKSNISFSLKSCLVVLSCVGITFFVTGIGINYFNNDLYARPHASNSRKKAARSGSTKRKSSARSGSTRKSSARSGSTKRKSSARSGSTRRGGKSARSGSTRRSSARSGSMRRDSSSSENGQFSGAPVSKTEYLGFTGSGKVSRSKHNSSCVYAYVNCMDVLIHKILNKNPFLGTDQAVKHLVLSDKPFRCVYAGAGNYDDYINDLLDSMKIQDTSFTFMLNEHFGGKGNNNQDFQQSNTTGNSNNNRKFDASKWVFENVKVYTKTLTGQIQQEGTRDIEEYWVTALYKKYNFFCQERRQSNDKSCAYSDSGHSDYMATKESTAYYMDLNSRVHGGCSNAFNEYPRTDDEDDNGNKIVSEDSLRKAEDDCKISGGIWHKPNSLKMVDMSADIMSDLGADQKGTCILQDSNGDNISQAACSRYGGEAEWGSLGDRAITGQESSNVCMLKEATATSCKSIDQVYANSGTGNMVPGKGNWTRKKEWAFVLNTAPPAMTLNPGEEFGWAHGICMTAATIEGVSKSKLKAVIKEQVTNKLNVDGKDTDETLLTYLEGLLSPREGRDNRGSKSYLEILGGCGEVEERLERFYMTGEWKEYESDCESLKNSNLVKKCKMGFALDKEDCSLEADPKKKEACERKNNGKGNKTTKKSDKSNAKVDCNKYMKKFTKEKNEWIEKVNKDCSNEAEDKKASCKTDKLAIENNPDYQKFIKTASYKGALSNKIKCEKRYGAESSSELETKVEVDLESGEKYIRLSDSSFMTPAKSCLQYEESLKATRNAWKAKAVEAIAENSRNIANQLKREEAKQLAADLKVNMEIASMTNKVFSACLGEMRSCMTKDNLCGKDYKDCVDVNGLRKDKLLPAGVECYAPFKVCMETTSRTLNIKNMSPQLQDVVRGLQQDPDKISHMAIDSIGESLGDTFDKIMETECKKVGGFYDNGICGMGVLSAKSSSKDKNEWSRTAASWTEVTTTTTVTTGTETVTSGRGKNKKTSTRPTSNTEVKTHDVNKHKEEYSHSEEHFEENKRNFGIVLAGTQIACSHKDSHTNSTDNVEARGHKIDKKGTKIEIGASCDMKTKTTVTSGSGVPEDTKPTTSAITNGSVTTKTENNILGMTSTSQASASCSTTEEILLISQSSSGVKVKTPEESCGFLFAPRGPWDKMFRLCLKPSERFVFPDESNKDYGQDALSILKSKLRKPSIGGGEIYGVYKNPTTKLKEYILRFVDNDYVVIRRYKQKLNKEGKINLNVSPVKFTLNNKSNEDWEMMSEYLGSSEDVCKPKSWLIRNEFPDVIFRWMVQFK